MEKSESNLQIGKAEWQKIVEHAAALLLLRGDEQQLLGGGLPQRLGGAQQDHLRHEAIKGAVLRRLLYGHRRDAVHHSQHLQRLYISQNISFREERFKFPWLISMDNFQQTCTVFH